MQRKLIEMLHMKRQPVGIYFANTETVCDFDAKPEARNCVIPLLMKVSEGQTISMDEKSCNCAGGAQEHSRKQHGNNTRSQTEPVNGYALFGIAYC